MLILVVGQPGCLQAVAWSTMLLTRIPTQGLREAARTTFDGQHPCGLCCLAKRLRAAEAEQPPTGETPAKSLKITKVESLPATLVLDCCAGPGREQLVAVAPLPLRDARPSGPEPPPPRRA